MKKKITISVVVIVVAIAVYFIFFNNKKPYQYPSDTTTFLHQLNQQRSKACEPVVTDINKTLWYKNSIIYTLDVEVFKDSDGDGIGDFKGLISKLDYIKSLGTDIIWLAPFYPTPNMDDGYDITDYFKVDPRVGTMDDYKNFISEANKRGMKVIIDLVFNHTSILHPWFQQSKNLHSPYHSWYV